MRLHFLNSTRAKKAAKRLSADLPSVALSSAQRAIARGLGYRDWHDFETTVAAGAPCPLDQALPYDAFVAQQAALTTAIAADLGVLDGDVQYALSWTRLTGDRAVTLDEQIAIRAACWRAGVLPYRGEREPGAVAELDVEGRRGESVILRSFGRPCSALAHGGMWAVADFEYIHGRADAPLFVPMRLYLPYGYWSEADGAQVVFSRDYNPLWRLREGREPERMEPWTWIRHVGQEWLWGEREEPWRTASIRVVAFDYLKAKGICRLPMLVDALPLLVKDLDANGFAKGAGLLQARRVPPPISSQAMAVPTLVVASVQGEAAP